MLTRQPLQGLTVVDEWLILSKRNFKFDLGDVLVLPSMEYGSRKWKRKGGNAH